MREQFDIQEQYSSKLKNDNIELKVQLEKLNEDGRNCAHEKVELNARLLECSKRLEDERKLAEKTTNDSSKWRDKSTQCDTKVSSLQAELMKMNATIKAIQLLNENNEALIMTLNQTINRLKIQLNERDKHSSNNNNNKNLTEIKISPSNNALMYGMNGALISSINNKTYSSNKSNRDKDNTTILSANGDRLSERVLPIMQNGDILNAPIQHNLHIANVANSDTIGAITTTTTVAAVMHQQYMKAMDNDRNIVLEGGEYEEEQPTKSNVLSGHMSALDGHDIHTGLEEPAAFEI